MATRLRYSGTRELLDRLMERLPPGDPERAAEFDARLNRCPDCEFFGGSHDIECPRVKD